MTTNTTTRAERLKMNTRLAILDNIAALRKQRKEARIQGKFEQAGEIQELIEKLLDQLDDMDAIALARLEDSKEVKQVIKDLRKAADELEDAASKITDIASALTKGAEILATAEKVVKGLAKLAA